MDDFAGLYTATLKVLGDTLVTMTSPEWDATMQDATTTQRTKAARLMLRVQEARLTLANTALGDILDKLTANEDGLQKGVTQLQDALAAFEKVGRVLSRISSILSIVGRIVPLVV
jgi:hypothetical protein